MISLLRGTAKFLFYCIIILILLNDPQLYRGGRSSARRRALMREFDMRSTCWGHNITVMSSEKQEDGLFRLTMWSTPVPKVGDRIRWTSGNSLEIVGEILTVDPQDNPKDMSFVDVRIVSYAAVDGEIGGIGGDVCTGDHELHRVDRVRFVFSFEQVTVKE